jgi:tRNA A37 threonylcarbamoyladenosine synthetase subunit TsaC/SUA5/YrdC
MTDPELMAEMYPDIDIIIDAGIGQTTPSTIIDCTEEEPIILRQGNGEITL